MSEQKNIGGRPHTERVNKRTIKLSNEAVELLSYQKNKSAFIDSLIRGDIAQIKCPHCGKVIMIKTE